MVVVSHAKYQAAAAQLRTFGDVLRLAEDAAFDMPYEALLSICAKRVEAELKTCMGQHRKADVADKYVQRYLRGETLTSIADSIALPPSMLCRVVLESHLNLAKGKEVNNLLKDPSQLTDERLRREVAHAVEADHFCGPYVDRVKHIAGVEYEELLAQKLRALGVPFLTEQQLRKRGDAKTPDAWLPVPLLVRGRLVHWIDSKATFGDAASHTDYHAKQFSSYIHRFDAGLVIYWFGYDQSISYEDPKLIVAEDLLASECELATCLPTAALQAAANPANGDGLSPDPIARSQLLLPSPPVSRGWSADSAADGSGHDAEREREAAISRLAASVVRYDISEAG